MPFKKVNSKNLFYTDTPSTSSTESSPYTTLFIHGLGSSSCFYSTIIPHLSQTRCIALDTPGSGLSTLGTKEQTIQTIAEDAIALLDALNVKEKVVVVGHSMGGIVASSIAELFAERIKGVVLLGPVDPAGTLRPVFEKRVEVVKKDGLEPLANTIPTSATGSKSTSLHHAFIRSLILGTSPEGYISLCNAISDATKPDYNTIKLPLLVLAGADDNTAPLAMAKTIANAYKTKDEEKKVQVLKGVGHWHCVEAPEEVAKYIGGFLRKNL
ncbi:3-oxoadipate enol-lactone hydrolase-like protein [Cadophora sp. MPI-SDFR-AT-0126]|nr:3-oxoadipate enol-lactone hydrolase-like protein [Leotiomycetes sp. MPI-SDFR-AT-0126]